VVFEQDAKPGEFAQVLDRDRRHFESALAFGHDEPFRRQPIEDLAQRADAEPVILLHRVQIVQTPHTCSLAILALPQKDADLPGSSHFVVAKVWEGNCTQYKTPLQKQINRVQIR
jgi:hypothetical protein